MGMQCTFKLDDLSQFPTYTEHDMESDTHTVTLLRACDMCGEFLQFHLTVPEDKIAENYECWFDCGSMSECAMNCIKFLIGNRIPFVCA